MGMMPVTEVNNIMEDCHVGNANYYDVKTKTVTIVTCLVSDICLIYTFNIPPLFRIVFVSEVLSPCTLQ